MTDTDLQAWTERLEPAGFWIRAAARLIDWFVLLLVGMVVVLLLALFAGVLEAIGRSGTGTYEAMMQSTFIGWIGGVVEILCYHTFFEGVPGAR